MNKNKIKPQKSKHKSVIFFVLALFVISGSLTIYRSYAATPPVGYVGDSLTFQAIPKLKALGYSKIDAVPGSKIWNSVNGIPDGVNSGRIAKLSNTYGVSTVVVALGTNEILFYDDTEQHLRDAITKAIQAIQPKDCVSWIVPNFIKRDGVSEEEHQRRKDSADRIFNVAQQVADFSTAYSSRKVRVYRWNPQDSDISSDGIHLTSTGINSYGIFLSKAGQNCVTNTPIK